MELGCRVNKYPASSHACAGHTCAGCRGQSQPSSMPALRCYRALQSARVHSRQLLTWYVYTSFLILSLSGARPHCVRAVARVHACARHSSETPAPLAYKRAHPSHNFRIYCSWIMQDLGLSSAWSLLLDSDAIREAESHFNSRLLPGHLSQRERHSRTMSKTCTTRRGKQETCKRRRVGPAPGFFQPIETASSHTHGDSPILDDFVSLRYFVCNTRVKYASGLSHNLQRTGTSVVEPTQKRTNRSPDAWDSQ
jgi:hypothetical protein